MSSSQPLTENAACWGLELFSYHCTFECTQMPLAPPRHALHRSKAKRGRHGAEVSLIAVPLF